MPERSPSLPSDQAPWVIALDVDQGFVARVREVWRYRRILWFFSLKSLQTLYSKTVLGPAWILIRTLVPLGVGSFVFGEIMAVPSGGVPYFVFFLAGQVPWNCFDGPLIRGSRGIEINRQLLTKLYVPRIILPLASMTAGVAEPVIIAVVLGTSLVYYRVNDGVWYVQPEPRLLAGAAAVVVVLTFAFSLTLLTSVWQARARDARFILRYTVGFWLFLTPVIYPLSTVPADIRWLVQINPLTPPVETFKWALLPGMQHSWPWFLYSVAVTVAAFLVGAWYFTRAESATVDKL